MSKRLQVNPQKNEEENMQSQKAMPKKVVLRTIIHFDAKSDQI